MHDARYREIPLRRRDDSVLDVAVVDAAEFAVLSQHRWHRNNNGYAVRGVWVKGKMQAVLMHRQILGLVRGDGLECDHINRDKLDNRRSNLRVVTHAENARNVPSFQGSTSQHRAVYWAKDKRRWRARVGLNKRYYHLGYFKDEAEAHAVVAAWWAERGQDAA